MNISKKLFFIAVIGLITHLGINAQDIAVALEIQHLDKASSDKAVMTLLLDKTQDETAARKIIENYTSELLAQTPPNKKRLKVASWLDKKMKSNVHWMHEFVPANYNPEPEEFIALAYVIDHYPHLSFKILQTLRANEKAEIATLDAKHALLKQQHPDYLRFIDAVGYSRQPQWLENDLISTLLVPSLEHPELKFICSKNAYEERKNKDFQD